MKRHKRDRGGFGKYIPHLTQGAKAEFWEFNAAPTHAHLSPSVPRSHGPELRTTETVRGAAA